MSKWECWRGSGVYISILCISVTSWSECFFLEIRWHMVFIVGLKSHRSRALESEVSLSSLKTKKTQLWGHLGHLHVASFQTCSTKRGKLTLGPYEIEYIPSQQSRWNEIILRFIKMTSHSLTAHFGFQYDYYFFFFKLMGRNQWPGCRLFIIPKKKKKKKALKSLLNIHNLLINAGMYSCFLLNQGNVLNVNYVLYFLPLQLGVKYV